MREAGDALVVFVQFHRVGNGSNYRNGKLLRFRAYADRVEALEAAGLRE